MAFAAKLSSLTEELIEVITSTTTQTEPGHVDALKESSLRKLRHHSFLRTNHFEVYAALDGYEERFRVLNRDSIADALKGRLEVLAQCSNKWIPDALHLLLQLADQPIQKSRLADLESLKEPEEDPGPKLRWDDIAKEDGWDGDREIWRNVDFGGYSSDDDYADHESDLSAQSEDTSPSSIEARYRKQPTDYLESSRGEVRLDEIWNSQAWRRKMTSGGSTVLSRKVFITELQAIREILFMLSGYENSLLDSQGKPSLDIQLTHASWQIFRSLLNSASKAGSGLFHLRQYVKRHQQIPLLQVFQEAIESRLRSFDSIISSIEAQYANIKQDVIASIMKILADIEPHLHPIQCLAGIVEQLQQSKHPQHFHYLELLYDSATTLQLEGDTGAYYFISQLFFECFEVYLRPIRLWMENGELVDDDKTFFISSSPAEVPRPQVWADQFKLKRTPQGTLFVPRFLQPAASKIFITGKSIVVLKLLGKHWLAQEKVPEPATRLDIRAASEFEPFPEIFKNMFEQWMQSKHHAASATLKQTLFQACNLWSDLKALQHIYLMSDGSRSDYVACAIFNNIDILNFHWHDRFNLTEIAREAFDALIESHRLTASVSSDGSSIHVNDVRQTVRKGLPSINIKYRLPWPVRIVLSDESLNPYQSVFTFLLQLRRASYTLTRHRLISGGLSYMTTEQQIFYRLRSKLLWFYNALQSYLSTLVLGPLISKFREDMTQAADVDQMITSHATFARRMLDETCLGTRLDPIHHAILDIFDLAIRLQDAYQMESERVEEGTQELSRLSVIRSSGKVNSRRYVKTSEEEDETFLSEQDTSAMIRGTERSVGQVLNEIRTDLDRHLKFICGGLRGVARASSSDAASKWDILAEMLEVGTQGY
ncbi:Spc98 family-domain-containing protein [Xylariaceae sp. FL1651]|nr:Spc98 family-domain-containing protein [Xylariaceae sp. FL1651]